MKSMNLLPKSAQDSVVIMTELVLPQHTNAIGSIFGGVVMSWIDIAAAISSGKYAKSSTVTASIDALHFIAPINLGHVVELRASVNFTGRTSMEIGVRVDSEHPLTGERFHNVSAYLTFVAIGSDGKPRPVPPLLLETDVQKRRYSAATKRRAARIALAKEIKDEADANPIS
jgi:acyl-CoA hydrolase